MFPGGRKVKLDQVVICSRSFSEWQSWVSDSGMPHSKTHTPHGHHRAEGPRSLTELILLGNQN